MLRGIDSRTALPPPNLSYLVPMDTGYMPIHKSEALTVLYIYLFTCTQWNRTVPFVNNSVIIYSPFSYNKVCGRCQSFPHKLDHLFRGYACLTCSFI